MTSEDTGEYQIFDPKLLGEEIIQSNKEQIRYNVMYTVLIWGLAKQNSPYS